MHCLIPVLLLSVVLAVMSDATEKEKRDNGCSKDACRYQLTCYPKGARLNTYCVSRKCVAGNDGFAKWSIIPGTDKGCKLWDRCIAYGATVKIDACRTKLCTRDKNGDATLVFAEGSATEKECVDKFGKCGFKNGDRVVVDKKGYEMLCTCIIVIPFNVHLNCKRV